MSGWAYIGTRGIFVFQGLLIPGSGLTVSSWSEKYCQVSLLSRNVLSEWNPGLSPAQSVHWAPSGTETFVPDCIIKIYADGS